MDLHLNNLFDRYQEQFGSGPGLGSGSGVCLMNIEGISSKIIESLFKASASLYRSDPWKKLRPGHLFTVKVGKDTDWSNKKQPFQCLQFIGGDGGNNIAMYMYKTMNTRLKISEDSWELARVPKIEILRVTYELESLLLPCNKKMVKSLCLEASGSNRYPVIDVARCIESNELQFRNPNLEELKLVFAVMKGFSLLHCLLQEDDKEVVRWPKMISFCPFIETVDVQWPLDMFKGHEFVAVTVSYPSGQTFEQKSTVSEDDEVEIVSSRLLTTD